MRFYTLLFSIVLPLFFSCKKNYTASASASQRQELTVESGTTNPPSLPGSLADTIPPSNAVDVKKYGAVGDGVHDDTNALQNIINAETVIVLSKGIYIINNMLTLKAGVKIYGTNGAIIKAGANMQGLMRTYGRYFYIHNTDNTSIINIHFQQSSQTFSLSSWANACVYIQDSKGTNISYNNFDFNLPYNPTGLEGVWVTGGNSVNNVIKNNKFTSVGVEYAESNASSTTVDGNTIIHAPYDALSAHGNGSAFCENNVVTNNIIQNAGLMGIEDWGKVNATLIRGNIITGTGKDPAQQSNGIGISVVGTNTQVINNQITDAQIYYIEVGGNGNCYVDSNVVKDTQGAAIGIMVNFTGPGGSESKYNGSQILNNTINNCYRSIVVFGNVTPNTVITSNTIINPVFIGINVDSAAPAYAINVANNSISFTVPNQALRKAFESYTSLAHSTSNQQYITLSNNVVTYATTAGGGTGLEYGFEIGTDNTVINANTFNGNSIRAGGSQVYAITGNTDPAYSITLTNNMVNNAIVSLKNFTIKTKSGNNF